MSKRLWMAALLVAVMVLTAVEVNAADTKLSALPSATLTEADELYINDGGTSKKATVAELRTAIGGVGFIMLDITSLRVITSNDIPNKAADPEGGMLVLDSVPILERSNDATDKSLRVHWVLSGVEEVQFPSVPMPPDLDSSADVTLHLVAEMSGATDTATAMTVSIWDGVGDTNAGGNTTPDFTDALGEFILTIGNADISGGPTGFFNISMFPEAHGTDAIFLYAVWIEYTKKLPS